MYIWRLCIVCHNPSVPALWMVCIFRCGVLPRCVVLPCVMWPPRRVTSTIGDCHQRLIDCLSVTDWLNDRFVCCLLIAPLKIVWDPVYYPSDWFSHWIQSFINQSLVFSRKLAVSLASVFWEFYGGSLGNMFAHFLAVYVCDIPTFLSVHLLSVVTSLIVVVGFIKHNFLNLTI